MRNSANKSKRRCVEQSVDVLLSPLRVQPLLAGHFHLLDLCPIVQCQRRFASALAVKSTQKINLILNCIKHYEKPRKDEHQMKDVLSRFRIRLSHSNKVLLDGLMIESKEHCMKQNKNLAESIGDIIWEKSDEIKILSNGDKLVLCQWCTGCRSGCRYNRKEYVASKHGFSFR